MHKMSCSFNTVKILKMEINTQFLQTMKRYQRRNRQFVAEKVSLPEKHDVRSREKSVSTLAGARKVQLNKTFQSELTNPCWRNDIWESET